MSDPGVQLSLLKLLASKHFPRRPPRRKVQMAQIVKAIGRIGSETSSEVAFENLCELKGRGLANTEPKIILKDEVDTAEFEIWVTPLGLTELQKRMSS